MATRDFATTDFTAGDTNNNEILDPNETWTYTGSHTVENTGHTSLTNVSVIDDNFTPDHITDDFFPTLSTKGNADAILDSGETWTYRYTRSNCQ
ncbi:hypothetical protein [Planktothrix mougeotii]|uniref:Uncharacterized protein n=1 Tax=Planktothrix mougeotii LEGE 06226 TaxID=1828728 RepID=A0ABR9UBL5_9CYAN|nr:hypothetical protein [Planktothrix mougeotii]MBE9143576.1 hypothetical protein [Planktothrix mougeotii LEGE 06226]